jgi:hypothetical protein
MARLAIGFYNSSIKSEGPQREPSEISINPKSQLLAFSLNAPTHKYHDFTLISVKKIKFYMRVMNLFIGIAD